MKIYNIILCIASLLLASSMSSCSLAPSSGNGELRTGDLVFVGIPSDYSLEDDTMGSAISASTGSVDSLNIIHVAILEVGQDTTWIIDATIRHNVARYPLDTFKRDFTLKDGSLPTFMVKRLRDSSGVARYVENAKSHIGEPYDVAFLPDNGAMYCSELVRESYRSPEGEYIFSEAPMNFLDSDGEFPLYWQQLFGMLSMPIPQGIEGTNPKAMSEEDVLVTVREGL